jgi:type II secretory pathway pseudopilin PulG
MLLNSYKLRVTSRESNIPPARAPLSTCTYHLPLATSPKALSRSNGFTFIEVLFAVILLGIGFIMIAAVFPVAIQQTSVVSDETQATAITRDAIKKIQAVADQPGASAMFPSTLLPSGPSIASFPVPGGSVTNALMTAIGSDIYSTADHRFGWVGFYRRDSATSPYAQIYIVALENPNFPNYLNPAPAPNQTTISAPVPPPIPPSIYNTVPPPAPQIQAQFNTDPAGNWWVQLSYSSGTANGATGAYVLIANGVYAGRFVRLGNQVPATIVAAASGLNPQSGGPNPQNFYLQPGWDFSAADAALNNPSTIGTPQVWMIGAAPLLNYTNTNASSQNDYSGPFSGPNQDIGVASAFIRINTANN